MTVSYGGLGGMATGAVLLMVTQQLVGLPGLHGLAGIALAASYLVVGVVLWVVSPLPDSNGGVAETDPLRGRYWGVHPGPFGTKPTHVSRHESELVVLFYFEDGYLAVDVETRASEWAASGETATERVLARRGSA